MKRLSQSKQLNSKSLNPLLFQDLSEKQSSDFKGGQQEFVAELAILRGFTKTESGLAGRLGIGS